MYWCLKELFLWKDNFHLSGVGQWKCIGPKPWYSMCGHLTTGEDKDLDCNYLVNLVEGFNQRTLASMPEQGWSEASRYFSKL